MPFGATTVTHRHGVFAGTFLDRFRDPLKVSDGYAGVDLFEEGPGIQNALFKRQFVFPAAPADP